MCSRTIVHDAEFRAALAARFATHVAPVPGVEERWLEMAEATFEHRSTFAAEVWPQLQEFEGVEVPGWVVQGSTVRAVDEGSTWAIFEGVSACAPQPMTCGWLNADLFFGIGRPWAVPVAEIGIGRVMHGLAPTTLVDVATSTCGHRMALDELRSVASATGHVVTAMFGVEGEPEGTYLFAPRASLGEVVPELDEVASFWERHGHPHVAHELQLAGNLYLPDLPDYPLASVALLQLAFGIPPALTFSVVEGGFFVAR